MAFVPPAGFDEVNNYMQTGVYANASELTRIRTVLEFIYCVLNGGGGGGGISTMRSVAFLAIANQHAYTAADVPNLSLIATKIMVQVTDDDAVITTLATWNGTTLTIDNSITIAGGELIVIIAQ